jgi:glycolate oxidase iron-sulfur subunit
MSALHDLARCLLALDDKIMYCMKCGFCQGVCPMFGASGMEADVTRGMLTLIHNLAHELIRNPEAVADKLGRCLLCGSCEAACSPGVKIMDIYLEAREVVHAYLGLHPVKKMVFRTLLAKPGLFNFAVRVGAPMQGIGLRKTSEAQSTACAPMLSFMLGNRHIWPLAPKPLHAKRGKLNEARAAGGLKVAFFPGCMGDKMYTDMSKACLKALSFHHVAVFMPDQLACCGIPALSSGDAQGMLGQMRVNLDILAGGDFDYLLSPCASCTTTIKEYWPRYAARLGGNAPKIAADIEAKAMDINVFLVDVLKVRPAPGNALAQSITYHDSCTSKNRLACPASHAPSLPPIRSIPPDGNGRSGPLLRLRRFLQSLPLQVVEQDRPAQV